MNDLNWIQVKIHNELPSDLCPVFTESDWSEVRQVTGQTGQRGHRSDRSQVRPFITNTAIQCKAYPSD